MMFPHFCVLPLQQVKSTSCVLPITTSYQLGFYLGCVTTQKPRPPSFVFIFTALGPITWFVMFVMLTTSVMTAI